MLSILLLVFGVFCCATSALMIKASDLHPTVLASYRLLLASLLLSPIYYRVVRQHHDNYSFHHLRLVLLPALSLALHFISWAYGAQMTHAANASLIVNMVPVVMPFLLFFTAREIVTTKEVIGTLISLSGVVWLASADFSVDPKNLMGDIVCFGSMLLFGYYLVQGRISQHFPNIWLYLVPLYTVAGTICFVVALFVANPLSLHPSKDYLLSLGLAFVPTIMGHSILNHSMKTMRGQIVSVMNLSQFLFAAALAYFLFHEVPQPVFYAAGALVIAGAIIVIRSVTPSPVNGKIGIAANSR
jgi:drug/metabolite transporter (DMT)-like permease